MRPIFIAPYLQYVLGPHWHGWANIEHMIVFGDSWSNTAFRPRQGSPTTAHPIRNAPWEHEYDEDLDFNWVTRMTSTYNETLVTTQNFAVGGSTISVPIVVQGRAMVDQVNTDFALLHANRSSTDAVIYDWNADATLAFIWFGVNDISRIVGQKVFDMFPYEFGVQRVLMDTLYDSGVRNFMLIDAPPYDVFPVATMLTNREVYQQASIDWKKNLTTISWDHAAKHADASVFVFSSFDLYTDIFANTCSFHEICGIETRGWHCRESGYKRPEILTHDRLTSVVELGDLSWDGDKSKCAMPVEKYMWVDAIHPTRVMHNATAHAMHDALKAAGP